MQKNQQADKIQKADSVTDNSLDTNSSEKEKNNAELASKVKDIGELVTLICSVIVLGMTCLRASLYSLCYSIPFYVVTSFSSVYDVTLSVTLIGAFFVMYYLPFYILKDFDYSKQCSMLKRCGYLAFIFFYGIVLIVLLDLYLSIVLPPSTMLLENILGIQICVPRSVGTIFLFVFYFVYFSALLLAYVEHLVIGVNKGLTVKKWFTYLARKINVYVFAVVISFVLFVPWLIYFYSSVSPYPIKKYEIVIVDGDKYAVVCESSDGKIIERCVEVNNELIIINDNHQYICEEDIGGLTFYVHTYSNVEVITSEELARRKAAET